MTRFQTGLLHPLPLLLLLFPPDSAIHLLGELTGRSLATPTRNKSLAGPAGRARPHRAPGRHGAPPQYHVFVLGHAWARGAVDNCHLPGRGRARQRARTHTHARTRHPETNMKRQSRRTSAHTPCVALGCTALDPLAAVAWASIFEVTRSPRTLNLAVSVGDTPGVNRPAPRRATRAPPHPPHEPPGRTASQPQLLLLLVPSPLVRAPPRPAVCLSERHSNFTTPSKYSQSPRRKDLYRTHTNVDVGHAYHSIRQARRAKLPACRVNANPFVRLLRIMAVALTLWWYQLR